MNHEAKFAITSAVSDMLPRYLYGNATSPDPKMGPQLDARQRTLAVVVLPGLRGG